MNKKNIYVKGKNWTINVRKLIKTMKDDPNWTILDMSIFLGIPQDMVRYHIQMLER